MTISSLAVMELCHSRDRPLSLPFPVRLEQTLQRRQAYVLLHKLNFPSGRLRVKVQSD